MVILNSYARPDWITARRTVEIQARADLSAHTAPALCSAIERHLHAGVAEIALNLEAVKQCDVVGLAALLQCTEVAAHRGVGFSILASPGVHRAALSAEVLDELPLVTAIFAESPHVTDLLDSFFPREESQFCARSQRLGLRPPVWDELELFERWANDPLLDQMVGSELLYKCRALGAYHPDVVAAVLSDPTSLTFLIEPLVPLRGPVGFVRLYSVHLSQQFAFLETAVASAESLRRGWGIEASRLFMAYALDVLRLHRVEAKVYAYNVLSANSLKRSGCRLEGVLRQARVYGGQRWDIHVYGILEEEMRIQRAREDFPHFGLWTMPC